MSKAGGASGSATGVPCTEQGGRSATEKGREGEGGWGGVCMVSIHAIAPATLCSQAGPCATPSAGCMTESVIPAHKVSCRGCRGSLSTSNRKSEDGACGNGAGARLSRRSIQVTRATQKRERPSLGRRCDRRERTRMATAAVLTHHQETRRQLRKCQLKKNKPSR